MVPLISICIPTFHEEKYIVKTLQKLAEQTLFAQSEIVIADYDPDKTKSTYNTLFDSLKGDYRFNGKIKFLEVYKSGVGIARHIASSAANGKYIVTFDADVKFENPRSLEFMIMPMESYEPKVIATHCLNVMEKIGKESVDRLGWMYDWRNEFLKFLLGGELDNALIIPPVYEPGLTFSKAIYQGMPGFRDVIMLEGPLMAADLKFKYGFDSILKLIPIDVIVSSRRIVGSQKDGQALGVDLNYKHAYR